MIHAVSANKESFRTVHFEGGLNVIIAERTESSTEKDTRNGLGKSTLIDIIDFCLGGSADRGKKLNIEPLQEWIFTLEATVASNRVKIMRAVATANRIIIEGESTGWPDQPDYDDETGQYFYNLARWRNVLGWSLFGLTASNNEERYQPSYRSLVSYFVRTKPGAYLEPFKYLPQQKGAISKVNVAFLLGLSWENTSKIQELEETGLGLDLDCRHCKPAMFPMLEVLASSKRSASSLNKKQVRQQGPSKLSECTLSTRPFKTTPTELQKSYIVS